MGAFQIVATYIKPVVGGTPTTADCPGWCSTIQRQFEMHPKQLNDTIGVNDEAMQTVNVHAETEPASWKENVISGYSQGITRHTINADGSTIIKVILKNINLVINQIEIYKEPD